jgi:DNA-binding MarR family transcriptional regulator
MINLIPKDCCLEDVGKMIQELVHVVQIFERDEIKPHGFTSTQCYVLITLKKEKELTMNELSLRLNLEKSTMTRILNILERDGYVLRTKSDQDKRQVIAALTQKGHAAAEAMTDSIESYYMKIVHHLPEGRVEEVLAAVSYLIHAFKQSNPKCC